MFRRRAFMGQMLRPHWWQPLKPASLHIDFVCVEGDAEGVFAHFRLFAVVWFHCIRQVTATPTQLWCRHLNIHWANLKWAPHLQQPHAPIAREAETERTSGCKRQRSHLQRFYQLSINLNFSIYVFGTDCDRRQPRCQRRVPVEAEMSQDKVSFKWELTALASGICAHRGRLLQLAAVRVCVISVKGFLIFNSGWSRIQLLSAANFFLTYLSPAAALLAENWVCYCCRPLTIIIFITAKSQQR